MTDHKLNVRVETAAPKTIPDDVFVFEDRLKELELQKIQGEQAVEIQKLKSRADAEQERLKDELGKRRLILRFSVLILGTVLALAIYLVLTSDDADLRQFSTHIIATVIGLAGGFLWPASNSAQNTE